MSLPYTLHSQTRITHDILALHFWPLAQPLVHEAGQFVRLIAGDTPLYCSIASMPAPDGKIIVHLRHAKELPEAMAFLKQLEACPEVSLDGPMGKMCLPKCSTKPQLFLAGGTGISPIGALLDKLTEAPPSTPIRCFWGIRQLSDLTCLEHFASWEKHFSDWKMTVVLSEPEESWKGLTGWVHEHASHALSDFSDWTVYAAGPFPMVDKAFHSLTEKGLKEQAFLSDMR